MLKIQNLKKIDECKTTKASPRTQTYGVHNIQEKEGI